MHIYSKKLDQEQVNINWTTKTVSNADLNKKNKRKYQAYFFFFLFLLSSLCQSCIIQGQTAPGSACLSDTLPDITHHQSLGL